MEASTRRRRSRTGKRVAERSSFVETVSPLYLNLMDGSLQEKVPTKEGASQPCRMARQGINTAREERRDMGREIGAQKIVFKAFQV